MAAPSEVLSPVPEGVSVPSYYTRLNPVTDAAGNATNVITSDEGSVNVSGITDASPEGSADGTTIQVYLAGYQSSQGTPSPSATVYSVSDAVTATDLNRKDAAGNELYGWTVTLPHSRARQWRLHPAELRQCRRRGDRQQHRHVPARAFHRNRYGHGNRTGIHRFHLPGARRHRGRVNPDSQYPEHAGGWRRFAGHHGRWSLLRLHRWRPIRSRTCRRAPSSTSRPQAPGSPARLPRCTTPPAPNIQASQRAAAPSAPSRISTSIRATEPTTRCPPSPTVSGTTTVVGDLGTYHYNVGEALAASDNGNVLLSGDYSDVRYFPYLASYGTDAGPSFSTDVPRPGAHAPSQDGTATAPSSSTTSATERTGSPARPTRWASRWRSTSARRARTTRRRPSRPDGTWSATRRERRPGRADPSDRQRHGRRRHARARVSAALAIAEPPGAARPDLSNQPGRRRRHRGGGHRHDRRRHHPLRWRRQPARDCHRRSRLSGRRVLLRLLGQPAIRGCPHSHRHRDRPGKRVDERRIGGPGRDHRPHARRPAASPLWSSAATTCWASSSRPSPP